MEVKINTLAAKVPQYEIERARFNELMQIKKTTDRYDIHGSKVVKISKSKAQATTFGKHTPTRIKSEFIHGPIALVCLTTTADKDPEKPDSYTYAATLFFGENEDLRVYRDSLNDGFTEARFCDDTVMLIAVKNRDTDEKSYLQIDGEPTGYGSWKFEEENENVNEHNKDIIQEYAKKTQEELGLAADKVFVVIQLTGC